jgi:hypothetical protein
VWLTPAQLLELTDRRYAKHQIRWLRENNYVFEIGGTGKPKVLRAYAEQRQGLTVAVKRSGPRLDGLAQRRMAANGP